VAYDRTQGFALKDKAGKKTEAKSVRQRERPLHSRRPVLCFPCICRYTASGNEEGSCFLEEPPEHEDTTPRSSTSSLMELKFELDTQFTVFCMVAAASVYSLVIGGPAQSFPPVFFSGGRPNFSKLSEEQKKQSPPRCSPF